MRHVFIINPAAGKRDCTAQLLEMAKGLEARHGLAVERILTRGPGHAWEAASALARTGEDLRFYACGGDGTLSEVANAVAGVESAAMTCVPVGTGNDFLKNFGDKAPLFSDAENLWDGPRFPLDAIDCNGRLALTVACSGFDAQVADSVHRYGDFPLLKGQASYIASLAVNFFSQSFRHRWTVTLDGERLEGEFILAAVCNGRYYGGGFVPTREARMDDGLLHTILVRAVSRPTFLRLVGAYSRGDGWRYPGIVRCSTAREITIESREGDIVTCLDGESVRGSRVDIRLSERRVGFFGPPGCDPNATAVSRPAAAGVY